MVAALLRLFFVMAATAGSSALLRLRRGPVDSTWSWRMSMTCALVHALLTWTLTLPRPLHRRIERLASTPVPHRHRREIRRGRIALGGVPAERYAHAECRRATVLYLHGGGYVGCTLGMYQALTSWLAWRTRAVTVALEYRLAPEHPFPAAVDDAVAAYKALLDEGVDPASIVVAGDSAGGGLSLALILSARERGLPMPAGVVLLSPYVDLTLPGASVSANAHSDILPLWPGHDVPQWYAGGADLALPLISPTYADLSGLPPLLVFAGGREIFRDDIRLFVERARRAGVAVDYREHEHMFHVWPLVIPWHPESRQAMEALTEFVDRRLTEAPAEAAPLGKVA